MTNNVALVVAPHPDDETLGCGGTLLKLKSKDVKTYWLIVTTIDDVAGFSKKKAAIRQLEIQAVKSAYEFDGVYCCGLPSAALDLIAKSDLVAEIGEVVHDIMPDTVYLPYRNDAHSDHAAVFDATVAATKTFRAPFVKSLYVYETLSETDFALRTDDSGFRPNLYEDITGHLDDKIQIMSLFEGEMLDFPFPRSELCIRALATLRGAQAGVSAAEAFMVLKEIR